MSDDPITPFSSDELTSLGHLLFNDLVATGECRLRLVELSKFKLRHGDDCDGTSLRVDESPLSGAACPIHGLFVMVEAELRQRFTKLKIG